MPYKYCRKFEPPEYGARTLQTTDRRQTDGWATANSEREREFTFTKMEWSGQAEEHQMKYGKRNSHWN